MEGHLSLKVLVYGYCHKGNAGDDFFQDAFELLFPQYRFTFTDCITCEQANSHDVLWIGGGSLLDGEIVAEPIARLSYQSMPTLYLGVGTETDIHPDHQYMLQHALLVATRTAGTTFAHPRLIHIPDLVYALSGRIQEAPTTKRLLFLPNISVVPNHADPHWKHSSWQYFKTECAQFLDQVIGNGYEVNFCAMSHNPEANDVWASAELLNMMRSRHGVRVLTYQARSFQQLLAVFGQYSHIVTQRYHGIVVADIAQRPVVSIAHHDKLKANSSVVPYYGVTKHDLLVQLESAKVNPVNADFTEFKAAVERACATLA